MLDLQGKLAKMIKSVGKIDHALYPSIVIPLHSAPLHTPPPTAMVIVWRVRGEII